MFIFAIYRFNEPRFRAKLLWQKWLEQFSDDSGESN